MKTKTYFKNDIFKLIMQIVVVAFSGILCGIVFKTFFEPQEIIPTGISGLALIIHNALSSFVNIPTSIIYLIFNVFIFAFAFKAFGWKFIFLSLVGMGFYTLAMQFGYIEALANASTEKLLYAIIGGIFSGAGVGLAMRFGGSTGGSDIAGSIINKYNPKIKTGFSILILNTIILVLSIITSGVQTGLYALVIILLTSMATNLVLDNSKRIVSFYIVCDNDVEIAEAILQKFHRGITRIEGMGMFSKKKKKVLLCLVPFQQAPDMKKLVAKLDDNAFVFSTSVDETVGEGDFLKIFSIFKNKVRKAKKKLKTDNKYLRHVKPRKLKYPKRKTKFYLKISK